MLQQRPAPLWRRIFAGFIDLCIVLLLFSVRTLHHVFTSVYVCMYVFMRVCLFYATCTYVRMYACMHNYACSYIFTYVVRTCLTRNENSYKCSDIKQLYVAL